MRTDDYDDNVKRETKFMLAC